jgi:ubiquinone/menaquinone biosynthesis C-methylase UbiE
MRADSVSYSRIADRYEKVRGGEDRARQLAQGLLPRLSGARRVCDVGAGTGIVSVRLRDAGHDVVAFDLSAEMLRQAAPRLPGRVAVADATTLPLRDSSVDAVTYVWVLHHVADLAAALREARCVVRADGRVIAISGMALPMDDDIDPVFRRLNLALRPDRVDQAAAVTRTGQEVGFEVVEEDHVALTFESSPNDVADAIEQRLFAHLWDLDDATWQRVVQPEVDCLRRLPDPDRKRQRHALHPLVVLQPSGGRP